MDTSKVLSELRAERDRINQAIAALEALTPTASATVQRSQSPAKARAGRKPSTAMPASATTAGRRTLSPAARRAMSRAAKKRWAAKKNAAQPQVRAMQPVTAKQSGPQQAAAKRKISASERTRRAEAAKKMWAERKKAA